MKNEIENKVSKNGLRKIALITVAASAVVYILGWFINIMDVDAAQYAAMTREMLERGDFLTFTDRGKDYLDKPPLLFWLSGLSMSLLGVNNIGYRFPAFLSTLFSLYSTYRLAVLYYGKKTGYIAVCVLATVQAVFLINHDVRADTNLLCWFIFSMWQLAAYLENRKLGHFVLAFIGIGLAMLAKGPIGLIAPGLAMAAHLAFTRQWRLMVDPRWLLGLMIVALCLLPMSYGLYTQFDLHPEKLVNGETGVSGLRFYYWTQSFGRVTGESIWDNGTGPFFLTHSTLWAFMPWSLLLILGLWREAADILRHVRGKRIKKEFLIFAGFLLPFMALSSSRYQLPHYAFIVYPLGAILTAKYLLRAFYYRKKLKAVAVYRAQWVILALALGFVCAVTWMAFPSQRIMAAVLAGMGLFILGVGVHFFSNGHRIILLSVTVAVFTNLILNACFYPELLHYQAGSEMALKARAGGMRSGTLYSYQAELPYSMDFYSSSFVKYEDDFDQLIGRKDIWVYTREELVKDFQDKRPDLQVVYTMGDYPVTQLSLDFLNPATRNGTLVKRCLIKL